MMEHDAAALLGVVHRTRGQTRSRLAELSWLPWVLYGVLSLIAVPMTWWFGEPVHGVYWALAVPVGVAITSWHYRRVEVRIGAEARIAPTLVGAGVIAVGAFGTGAVGGALGWPMLAATGPAFSIAAGLSIFAVVRRSVGLALAAGTITILAGAVLVAGTDARPASMILLMVCGLVGIAVGIGSRRSSRRAQ